MFDAYGGYYRRKEQRGEEYQNNIINSMTKTELLNYRIKDISDLYQERKLSLISNLIVTLINLKMYGQRLLSR